MTVTFAQFITDFPEFNPAVTQGAFNVWYDIAGLLLNPIRWPNTPSATTGLSMLDRGAELFVAHNLALEQRAQAEASNGVPPGGTQGPLSAKSVGPVSVSYDTASGIEVDAGHWNLTIYGTRFIRLLRTVCAGPVQVGIGADPSCGLNGPAWPGPYPYPEMGGTGFGS